MNYIKQIECEVYCRKFYWKKEDDVKKLLEVNYTSWYPEKMFWQRQLMFIRRKYTIFTYDKMYDEIDRFLMEKMINGIIKDYKLTLMNKQNKKHLLEIVNKYDKRSKLVIKL